MIIDLKLFARGQAWALRAFLSFFLSTRDAKKGRHLLLLPISGFVTIDLVREKRSCAAPLSPEKARKDFFPPPSKERLFCRQALEPFTLVVVEQIPGHVEYADATTELERGYFPSYNVPYFKNVYERSGYPTLDKRKGRASGLGSPSPIRGVARVGGVYEARGCTISRVF